MKLCFLLILLLVSTSALRGKDPGSIEIGCENSHEKHGCNELAVVTPRPYEIKSDCTPEQIESKEANCVHLAHRRLFVKILLDIIAGAVLKELIELWVDQNNVKPVESLKMKAVASDDDLDLVIIGGEVLTLLFRDPSVIEFEGKILDRNEKPLWKYYFKLTIDENFNDELWLEGWVQHFYETHDQDQLEGARLDFGHNGNLYVEPSGTLSDEEERYCKSHQKKPAREFPQYEGLPEHEDCLELAKLTITRQTNYLTGRRINAFRVDIKAHHYEGTNSPTSSPAALTSGPTGSPTGSPTRSPVYSRGEPHFRVWGGETFDYQGECDLVFVSNPDFANGLGLDIHIRTTVRYYYSYIESAAIKIGNSILEVDSFGMYMLDGVSNADIENATVSGFPLTLQILSEKQRKFEIMLGMGSPDVSGSSTISITTMKDIVSVNISPGKNTLENTFLSMFGNSTGLVGSLSSKGLLARDGVTVLNEPDDFGQEWQRRDSDPKLFQLKDRAPQYPQKCILPSQSQTSRRLGETVSRDTAIKACADWSAEEKEDCIYDVVTTGDLDYAKAGAY